MWHCIIYRAMIAELQKGHIHWLISLVNESVISIVSTDSQEGVNSYTVTELMPLPSPILSKFSLEL